MKKTVILLLVITGVLSAGNTGKIAGHISGKKTGEALIGVNVIVTGTIHGASSDYNGDYFIINISPGVYDLKVMLIGYETINISGIRVDSDLTTTMNFEMSETVLTGQEILVTAERPVVQMNSTSTSTSVDGEKIENMPVNDIKDVMKTASGVVAREGKLFIRGGRSNEVSYLVDGVSNMDPMFGNSGHSVSTGAIEELTLVTGTFNAEYGQAMSGVVNVVTKSGRNRHEGRVRYFYGHPGQSGGHGFEYDPEKIGTHIESEPFTDGDGDLTYNEGENFRDWNRNGEWDSDSAKFNQMKNDLNRSFGDFQRYELSLTGPVFRDHLFYTLNLEGLKDEGYLPYASRNNDGILGTPFGNVFLKLLFRYNGLSFFGSINNANRVSRNYDHFWKYLPYRQAYNEDNSRQATLSGSYQFSPRTFAELSYSSFSTGVFTGTFREWVFNDSIGPYFGGQEVFAAYYDDPEEFAVGGYDSKWVDSNTLRHIFKGSITSQVNKYNLVKVGGSYIRNSLRRISHDSMEDYDWINQDYQYEPVEAAVYIQDKVEIKEIILNMGLRYDYFDPKAQYWDDPKEVGIKDSLVKASVKWQISPRLGFSHPISDRSKLHFAYGHFLQIPDYQFLYWNHSNSKDENDEYIYMPQQIAVHNPTIGNPDLKPQKTVAIEIGWEQQIDKATGISMTAYYKDIQNLIASRLIPSVPASYTEYINTDYANIRGLEISLNHKFYNFMDFSLSYTLSRAEGNSSDIFEAFYDIFDTPPKTLPKRVLLLDWDQTHTVNIVANANTSGLSSVLLKDWTISMIGNFGSGLPYTPENTQGLRTGEINSERMPPTMNIDVYVSRTLPLLSGVRVFTEINNLTNRKNVANVHATTGLPDQSLFSDATVDGVNNPGYYEPPRRIKFGVEFSW